MSERGTCPDCGGSGCATCGGTGGIRAAGQYIAEADRRLAELKGECARLKDALDERDRRIASLESAQQGWNQEENFDFRKLRRQLKKAEKRAEKAEARVADLEAGRHMAGLAAIAATALVDACGGSHADALSVLHLHYPSSVFPDLGPNTKATGDLGPAFVRAIRREIGDRAAAAANEKKGKA